MTSFYTALRERWTDPDKLAVRYRDTALRYRDLEEAVMKALGFLRAQGLKSGDVLALQLPRELAFLELHLAALAGGIVTLPLNPAYTDREVDFYLRDARPALAILLSEPGEDVPFIAADAVRPLLDAAAPSAPLDTLSAGHPAVICYTSGTTGRPKGAVIEHRNILGTVAGLHEAWRWSADDVLLHALPLFHIHGLFVAQHGALYAGASTVWMERFEPEAALAAMSGGEVTIFMGVPTFYSRLLAAPARPLPGMRLLTSGSAPLPARVHATFDARFGHRILERYGMTEVGIVLSNPYDRPRRPGTVGFPLPGVRVRICDDEGVELVDGEVGELRIQGPGVIGGYLGLPEQTKAAIVGGWMRSGDLAMRDEDGYIHIVGRAKDMIISGGLNVYPVEIESVLLEHPAVGAAAVVGLPDEDWGERVVAAVVAVQPVSAEVLLAVCREGLAGYKRPKEIVFVDALPRNAMGKVEKARLRASLAGESR
ncbi:MAG: malonyl-CoA/methylmalonyl-CoA synthetase [Myxococcota bacterium]|jgi:malonyl-CoA/methylmalonyl-CoA synthetase